MKSSHIFFYLLTVLLLAIIFLAPPVGWRIHAWLTPTPQSNSQDQNTLAAENVALKAQMAQYQIVASELPTIPQNYIPAMVYSRYPSNFRNEILINVGSAEDIQEGRAVVGEIATSSYILIGKVVGVFPETSLVQTVFDPGFKMPVRIGASGYDGLLLGGESPIIASIAKKSAIQTGDAVISADPALPYGLPIAEIKDVSISPDSLFQQASLIFSYDIGGIEAVLVAK